MALLNSNPNPDDEAINAAMAGNICRCGMYDRIRRGIKRAASAGVAYYEPAAAGEAEHG